MTDKQLELIEAAAKRGDCITPTIVLQMVEIIIDNQRRFCQIQKTAENMETAVKWLIQGEGK